ncbi:hypothetical protein [Lentzea guizhouensis]|uniref:hypothetical protein n=1 Tax=Lentzea guizhouensis TaxID=1586287 RepID=UPI001F2A162D|nr:hypothetical protein [Lentzea guizhouensis]
MDEFLHTKDSAIVRGAKAGDGPGYTLEAIAVRISHDITEARKREDLPAYTRTVVTVLPWQRMLHIRVEGFDTVPARATSRAVITTLFDLVSTYNIIPLDSVELPLFTQHIVLVDSFGQPFAAIVGAGAGEAEPVMQ